MIRGLIGGTGCLSLFQGERQEIKVTTPYGAVTLYEVAKECYLLLRHGSNHSIPPHMINYRANIWALNEVGVEALLGIYAVGSISDHLKVGEATLVEQFIDFSGGGRPSTFFDDEAKHINLELPYSQPYNRALLAKAKEEGITLKEGGVYVCTNGPRLETPAEIEMLRRLGGGLCGDDRWPPRQSWLTSSQSPSQLLPTLSTGQPELIKSSPSSLKRSGSPS